MSTDPKTVKLDAAAEADLDALLAELAAAPDEVPTDLLARIEADGLAAQPKSKTDPALAAAPVAPPARGGFWGLRLGPGGWSSLGGLTAALVVGFGLGLTSPDTVSTLTSGLVGDTDPALEDVFWSFDDSLLEG